MDEKPLTYDTLDKSLLTPMMKQYLDQKDQCRDAILMFRLGDFYEMFFDDAITASSVLELALTGRDCGLNKRAPMCGIPHHASQSYIGKLVSHGYKVAICDQIEDPALAKGIVKRAITRILTPGTLVDSTSLDEKKNNYLLAIYRLGMQYGISVADITTGTFEATQLVIGNTDAQLVNLVSRYSPSEIICNRTFANVPIKKILEDLISIEVQVRPDSEFTTETASRLAFERSNAPGNNDSRHLLLSAAGGLLYYLDETQRFTVNHFSKIRVFSISETMELDLPTRINLELNQTIRSKSKRGSLLWAIDRTVTSMGGRLLRRWLDEPLIQVDQINQRQDSIEEMYESFIYRQELVEAMTGISDMERLVSKITLSSANPRDLIHLKNTLAKLPYIRLASQRFSKGVLGDRSADFDDLNDVFKLIDRSIDDDAPITLKDGGIIRPGYSEEIDQLRKASEHGKDFMIGLESREREKTGIKNLKIGYNRVFGYYIEVSKGNLASVPDYFVRKQTLTNAERFITDELKSMEDTILGAQQRLTALEYDLFIEIRNKIAEHASRLYSTADHIALLDVLSTLAELAQRQQFIRPVVDDSHDLIIESGRHPVVEQVLQAGDFVPNDTLMNNDSRRIMVLTGPNMSGKSTYMRQVALIVLLAQTGSFVPAKYARIGVVDRVFTRIGSSDDISSGQSTFMIEMNEAASILRNATRRSLILMDEIGRGTSTFDGLSIAWSILEFIADPSVMFARTIFATHYHELNTMAGRIPGIFNAHVEVEEKSGSIVFLHKIENGGTDDSYGIEVARLAGVPEEVIRRAGEVLKSLEKSKIINDGMTSQERNVSDDPLNGETSPVVPMSGQLDIFALRKSFVRQDPIRHELLNLDITTMTPLESMNFLYALIDRAMNDEREETEKEEDTDGQN
ncbi:MAG: DNA mismatch repair protein MutS [Clostridiales bacterium]|nr:DNA mismatch repair protein MutS [Clostridiales bacterium]